MRFFEKEKDNKRETGGGKPTDLKLYNEIKKKIYADNPTHSVFRSAQIIKQYKQQKGKFDDSELPKMNIKKWFTNQNWISVNDYYHNKKIIPCGSTDTNTKYKEYPLCRPLKIVKSLKPEQMKEDEQLDELSDIKRLAGQEEVDEGLGKALLGGAALIAAVTGLSKMEAHRMMTSEPQLIALAQMRQEAEQKGDEYKVKELDDRIEKTMSHIGITGRPVMGGDGEPIDPRKPWAGESVQEAEYQGRKVPLGKPMQGDVAKSKVYVKNAKGNVVKVNFGDKNMTIKKNNPARRKSFRARHNCENPGPKWKARYWSCRAW